MNYDEPIPSVFRASRRALFLEIYKQHEETVHNDSSNKSGQLLVWLFLQFVLASYIFRTLREVKPVNQVDKKQGTQAQ